MGISGVIDDLAGIDFQIRKGNDILGEFDAHGRPLKWCD